jgi:peptidoglycan/LPS O-acetylase OafA/YrhL
MIARGHIEAPFSVAGDRRQRQPFDCVPLRRSTARALATAAYSLYLTHKMVFHAVQMSALHWPGLQQFALAGALIAALEAGAVLYWSVERPFLKLRERLAVAAPLR